MPKEPRGKVYPMADRTLDGCDVRPGKGLFSYDVYVVSTCNIKRMDDDGETYLLRIGEWIEGSIPRTIYYRSLDHALDYSQAYRAAKLFLEHMKQQQIHPVKMYAAYLMAQITILKWRVKWNL